MEKTINPQPLVSVIMPVYNAGNFLNGAVKSILNQTYNNFELLIIDDASTDNAPSHFLKEIVGRDSRVRLIIHSKNKGLVATLNEGLQLSQGNYIARMDSDDLCETNRLEKQMRFFQKNPDIVVLGSMYIRLNERDEIISVEPTPIMCKDVAFGLNIKNCFCHGSIMINRKGVPPALLKYSSKYPHAEDYELWLRLSSNGLKLANLPEPLYYWRSHQESTSILNDEEQKKSVQKIITSTNKQRLKFGFFEIFLFAWSGITQKQNSFTLHKEKYDSHLKREYQYILFEYARLVSRAKPLHSILALCSIVIISPKNILKKILYAY